MRQSREIRKGALLHSAPAPGYCAVVAADRSPVRRTKDAPSFEEINRRLEDIGRKIAAMRKPAK